VRLFRLENVSFVNKDKVIEQPSGALADASYFNIFNEANSKIFEATSIPEAKLQALIDSQEYYLAPAKFINSLRARVRIFESQLKTLINLIPSTISKSNKLAFEWQGASLINGMALATSKPLSNDFENANDGLEIASILNSSFSSYISTIDSFQTDNGAESNRYSPDQDNFQALSSLVNYSTSNALNIALNSKQQRLFLLNNDSNLIELTHRFYGLDENDDNIKSLIKQNNWGINFYLQVPKNTEVKYYV
jgi:hypothetical protein